MKLGYGYKCIHVRYVKGLISGEYIFFSKSLGHENLKVSSKTKITHSKLVSNKSS